MVHVRHVPLLSAVVWILSGDDVIFPLSERFKSSFAGGKTLDSHDIQTRRRISARTYILHGALFIATFITTTFAGVQWLNRYPTELTNFTAGIPYALLLLAMLSSHEFGHYIAARLHGADATLPYYIPLPPLPGFDPTFGTLGAVIRLRSPLYSRRSVFDIGAAGPIAGFVVTFIILAVGFRTLPSIDYLYAIHPEYAHMERIPETGLTFGRNLFYSLAQWLFAPRGSFVPPMNEIYHYPFLCVGWFGMFVTALNLIPISQLDGGHISFAMFGRAYHRIAQVALIILVVLGTLGLLPLIGVTSVVGWVGWLFWALLLVIFMRSVRLSRPPVADETPLDPVRMAVGWICVIIFIGTFSPVPFSLELS